MPSDLRSRYLNEHQFRRDERFVVCAESCLFGGGTWSSDVLTDTAHSSGLGIASGLCMECPDRSVRV